MDENTMINKAIDSQLNQISNTKNLMDESSEESFHRANFEKFLENFRNKKLFAGASWNKLRESTYKEQQNRRKIVLKEIDQLDSKVNKKFYQGSFKHNKRRLPKRPLLPAFAVE